MAEDDRWLSVPKDLFELTERIDRLFDELIHQRWGFTAPALEWNPSWDLYETEDAFILEVDLPGTRKEDVKVAVEGQDLIVEGARASEQTHTSGKVHYRERQSGRFVRRARLPESVDKERIVAEFRDGVLRVTLPKMKREQGGR
jgi:HSP20 family protein